MATTAGASATPTSPMPASLWRRLGGYVVDIVVITLVLSPLLIPAMLAQIDHNEAVSSATADPTSQELASLPLWARQWFVLTVVTVAFGIYRVVQLGATGRTLGHRLAGTRVVAFDGSVRLGWGRSVLRYVVFYGVSLVPVAGPLFSVVNYLWCTFDRPYRQCLHDKIAGTFVLQASSVATLHARAPATQRV